MGLAPCFLHSRTTSCRDVAGDHTQTRKHASTKLGFRKHFTQHFRPKIYFLSIIIARVFESICDGVVVDAHPVRSQVTGELSMHGTRLNKLAQVMLSLLLNNVDSKCVIKLFRRPNAAKAVGVLLVVVPIRLRNFGVHVHNAKETFHRLLACPGIFICVLPESLDLASLGLVLSIGIVMKTNAAFCRIEIISNCKPPDTDGHFLSCTRGDYR